jgi:hypothetical protein
VNIKSLPACWAFLLQLGLASPIPAHFNSVGFECAEQSRAAGQCQMSRAKAPIGQIVFSFHPRWGEEPADDVSLTLKGDGKARAFRYDYHALTVTGAFEGHLATPEVERFTSQAEEVFREIDAAEPADKNIITEGDLFQLSIERRDGTSRAAGGKVADVPARARERIRELSTLWKQLKEVQRAEAYVEANAIEKERLALLLREGKLRFTALEEFPPLLQPALRDAISPPFTFRPLTRSQYSQLETYKSYGEVYVVAGDRGYNLMLFRSRPPGAPAKTRP